MGTGIHGGFGNTRGIKERYRIGRPVLPTEKTLSMSLDKTEYIGAIVKKYNIHLKSGKDKIDVIINPDLAPAGRVVKSRPTIIELGPRAFVNETELANTIAHELNHARSYTRGGTAPEEKAYHAGDALEDYIRGKR